MIHSVGEPDISVESLVQLLQEHASAEPEHVIFEFSAEETQILRFGQLAEQARGIAAALQQTCAPGDRVLLLYPPGLEFISAFFGCLYAGMLAVPLMYPKPRRSQTRLSAVAQDCEAKCVLSTQGTLELLDLPQSTPELTQLHWIATDELPDDLEEAWLPCEPSAEDVAFLQYTSGSTSQPKGVMISHGNLLFNLEMIRQAFALQPQDHAVFWLPAYHDMGLIGGILAPIYGRGTCHLMSPAAFLQRPLRWLQMISDHQAAISGGPNFAFDLCARKISAEQLESLDLSAWRLAFCGAEPIRPQSLREFAAKFRSCGFSPTAFYPCYGLAEATLLTTGGPRPKEPQTTHVSVSGLSQHRVIQAPRSGERTVELVGCGGPLLGQRIAIVDPHSQRECHGDEIGEIWVQGPSVAYGYWNRPAESQQVFQASLADSAEAGFLRTGDLGFIQDGQLFVTGRLKDIIVIRGRNHYPQDIEHTAEQVHPALRALSAAAFALETERAERLAIVAEVERTARDVDWQKVLQEIRRAVLNEHEIEPYSISLIRQGSLPRTTSGKIQRYRCREQLQAGTLNEIATWKATAEESSMNIPGPDSSTQPKQHSAEEIETWMMQWLVAKGNVPEEELDRNRPFAEFGLDSMAALEMIQEAEDQYGVVLPPTVAWNYPTPKALAGYLANPQAVPTPSNPPPAASAETSVEAPDETARLLAELEASGLSQAEIEALLREVESSGDEQA